MKPLALDTDRVVIVITGHPFSGKSTVGHRLASLSNFHHLDNDNVRHALFPRNRVLKGEDRGRVHRHTNKLFVAAAKVNLQIGQSVIMTATLGAPEARRPLLTWWLRAKDVVPMYFFRLVLPEPVRVMLIRQRALTRYGSNEELLQRKLAGYEYVRSKTVPWPPDVQITDVDASTTVEEVCQVIISHVPHLQRLVQV